MTAAVGERTRHRGNLRMSGPYVPTLAEVEFAARVVDALAARREVVVRLPGPACGGWYVVGVDAVRFTFALWRDGVAVEVPWGDVTE